MKELRTDTRYQVLRIAFAFDPDRSAIWLLDGNKSGVSQKRFYKQLIARADVLHDETSRGLRRERKEGGKSMARSFDELVKRATTRKTRQRAAARTRQLLGELLLSEIRERAGKTQQEVAEALNIKQPSLSKLEKQNGVKVG